MKQRGIISRLFICSLSFIFVFVLAFSANVLNVYAQTTNGSLTGIVTDEQGAAIPGAKVSIISLDRNQTEGDTQTTDDGNYTFPALIPGTYKVIAEQTGFSRIEISPVVIELNVRQRVDVKMTVGNVTRLFGVT